MSVLASSTRRFRRACPCQQFALIRVLLRPLFSLFKQPRSLASTRAISAHFSAHFLQRLSPPSTFPSSLPLSFFVVPFFRVDRALKAMSAPSAGKRRLSWQAPTPNDLDRVALTTVSRRVGAAKSINAIDAPTNCVCFVSLSGRRPCGDTRSSIRALSRQAPSPNDLKWP